MYLTSLLTIFSLTYNTFSNTWGSRILQWYQTISRLLYPLAKLSFKMGHVKRKQKLSTLTTVFRYNFCVNVSIC